MSNNDYKINGYDIHYTYAGIDQYTIYKGGKEICTCWSISEVASRIGVDGGTVREEMWKQRYI